jgi:hypothetical protein
MKHGAGVTGMMAPRQHHPGHGLAATPHPRCRKDSVALAMLVPEAEQNWSARATTRCWITPEAVMSRPPALATGPRQQSLGARGRFREEGSPGSGRHGGRVHRKRQWRTASRSRPLSFRTSLLCQGRSTVCGFPSAGDGGWGRWEGACSGVPSVGAGWSRAAEGLRTRRLASARSEWVVIASAWGCAELVGGARRLVAGCRWALGRTAGG